MLIPPIGSIAREIVHPRMSALGALILVCGLTACGYPEPGLSNEQIQRLRADLPGLTEECVQLIQRAGIEAMPDRVDQCFAMTPPQRWRGLWRDDFEGQTFCPEPAQACSGESQEGAIWLTFSDGSRPAVNAAVGETYLIEFVGRRTSRPGRHGHMGLFSHEMMVDNLISVSPLTQR